MSGPIPFIAAQASSDSWQQAIGQILPVLQKCGPEHRLGLIYMTPEFASEFADIEVLLRQSTGVPHWVGTIGFGTIGTNRSGSLDECYGTPAVSVLLCPFAEDAFRIFSGVRGESDRISATHEEWLAQYGPPMILAHGDSDNGLLGGIIDDIVQETDGFLIGGLSVGHGNGSQVADGADGQGLSGAMLSLSELPIQTALSQGCSPIGPVHTVTAGEEHAIFELNGRPALDVFKEDIGEILSRDLNRCAGYIFAALPVAGSDSGDYTVRDLLAIDPQHRALAVGASMRPGDGIMFCRRDPVSATADMRRMLGDLKSRIGDRPVRGGVYVSCAARGPNQFSDPALETQLIEETFGAFPLTGFFANGEFSRDRIYTYTGVLTLFL
ncbi:MAG: FIST C-terminal domain-containing protein [Alphaproteobacteria bacterium]|nr:FIST C-terminal domain-containing protein [Alphaproteobacteria bacterium]